MYFFLEPLKLYSLEKNKKILSFFFFQGENALKIFWNMIFNWILNVAKYYFIYS